MIRNTIWSRVAVAAGFLAFFGVVLAGARLSTIEEVSGPPAGSYLIISSAELLPAFQDLGEWIRDEGGGSLVLSLETVGSRRTPEDRNRLFRYLGDVARGHGFATLIVAEGANAANASAVDGLPWTDPVTDAPARGIQHAPVASLSEAWDFVARCRSRGLPLQRSLFAQEPLLSGTPGSPLHESGVPSGTLSAAIPVMALRTPLQGR